MSGLTKNERKGRKALRFGLSLALLLAMLVTVGLTTASARFNGETAKSTTWASDETGKLVTMTPISPEGGFTKTYSGKKQDEWVQNGYWWDVVSKWVVKNVDSEMFAAVDETVLFSQQDVFTVNDASNVRAIRVEATNAGSNSDFNITFSDGGAAWGMEKPFDGPNVTTCEYRSSRNISKDQIQKLLDVIQVKYKGTESASATFNVYFSTNKNAEKSWEGTQYSMKVNFYTFATGSLKENTKKVTYSADRGNDTYMDYVKEEHATATVDLHIDEYGGARQIEYGYMLRKKSNSSSWTGVDRVKVGTLSDAQATRPQNDTVQISADFPAGEDYEIKGYLITDSKSTAAKETDVITVRYDKPVITNFNIGSTDTPSLGGNDGKPKNIAFNFSFNNTNYDSQENESPVNGKSYYGMAVKYELFYTNNLVKNPTKVDGKTINVDATANWQLTDVSEIWVPQNAGMSPSEVERSLSKTVTHQLPKDDSKACAYKLVVTDMLTGFKVYSYSSEFTVDSTKPTEPKINRLDADGNVNNIMLGTGNGQQAIVGGSDSKVNLQLSGATDTGSGVAAYSYSMYYLSADAGSEYSKALNTSDAKDILNHMMNMDAGTSDLTGGLSGVSKAAYTDWTNLPLTDGKAKFSVSKDGYYRIDSRVTDYAGRTSTIVKTVFRVDLTVPPAPQAELMRGTLDDWLPYDSRQYTETTVWVFIKAPVVPGKTFSTYEYSLDGGLNWIDYTKTLPRKDDGSYTPGVYKSSGGIINPYYTTTEFNSSQGRPANPFVDQKTMNYDVAFQLSNNDISGYQSVVTRVKDNLGNTSLVSSACIMRTTDKIKTSATLSHDPIEVALAMGNTTMKTSTLTPQLKNAAAKKINLKYYGSSGSATMGASNFNPYLYVGSHSCAWGDDSSCSGACHSGSSCPYAVMEKNGYTIYKPEYVNVQGISNADASVGMKWYHFDHTSLGSYAKPAAGLGKDYLNPNGKYNAMNSYVKTSGFESTSSQWSDTNPSSAGNFNKTVAYRIYHMMPFPDSAATVDLTKENDSNFKIDNIRTYGYYTGYTRDWMFLYNDQGAKKNIGFTIDDSKVYPHSNDGYGFLFNTTIRQNKAGSWVVSGYLFSIAKYAGTSSSSITAYRWGLIKLTDMSVDSLMSANSITKMGGHIYSSYDPGLYGGTAIRHFRLITEGDTTKIYCYQGPNDTAENLEKKFNSDTNYGETDGKSSYTAGYKAVNFGGGTKLNTPRPTVDSETIGATGNANHVDTNCYGFGPFVGSTSDGHTCTTDTQIVFSNMVLKMNVVRKLSEVVTEPQWGNGKAKFITNISNDAVADFKDPILTSQIQWRLNNDKAKYIGWGVAGNKTETMNFLSRLSGLSASNETALRAYGMYESTAVAEATQIDDIATYITEQYYAAFGYDGTTSSNPIVNQVSPTIGIKKGTVYSMDDISNINFQVEPKEYNTSTANPDFPSGRWYMVHDTNGYETTVDPRNERYSDALEFNITLPGRYTIYFAPSKEDVKNGTLDPDTAVFDFIVDQKPTATFTGSIVGNALKLQDYSKDPDYKSSKNGVNANTLTYKMNGITYTYPSQQLSGITKTEWRYELLKKNGENLETVAKSDWGTTNPDGWSVSKLSNSKYPSMPENAVLTVYQRVTDISTRRVAVKTNDKVTGYKYVQAGEKVSSICQQNVTSSSGSVDITYPPLSSFSLSSVNMYNTAQGDNKNITITRSSSHPQENKNFAVSWAIDLGADYKKSDRTDNYIPLTKSGNNYTATFKNNKTGASYTNEPVLTYVTGMSSTNENINGVTSSTGGQWKISYDFIQKFVGLDSNMVLQITETSYGVSSEDAALGNTTKKSYITDSSARAIYYRKDTNPPTPQSVTAETITTKNGVETPSSYEASSYLDVTDGTKSIRFTVRGSQDMEGTLTGYQYYLYSKNPTSGQPDKYYLHNPDGTKTLVGSATAATRSLNSYNTGDSNSVTIDLKKAVMDTSKSTEEISIAIWARDNGNNTTKPTKIEDVKFSVSEPMPAAIKVTDTQSQVVAEVGNKAGFDPNAGAPFYNASAKDNLTSKTGFSAGSSVTIEFAPYQYNFKYENGNLVPDSGSSSTYYVDKFGKADPTGINDIIYTLERKNNVTGQYEIYRKGSEEYRDIRISPSLSVTVDETGEYRITAKVINGAGSISKTREATFIVDVEKPTLLDFSFFDEGRGVQYVEGTWAKSVTMKISNGDDNYPDSAYYVVSVDNGATWKVYDYEQGKWIDYEDGTLRLDYTGGLVPCDYPLTETGTYQVRVKVRDKAGNESETVVDETGKQISKKVVEKTVKIDAEPPEVPDPVLTASMVESNVYGEYILNTYNETPDYGKLQYMSTGTLVDDTEISIAPNGRATFYATPNDGYELEYILLKGEDVTDYRELNIDGKKTYVFTVSNIKEDQDIVVAFKPVAAANSYMASSRMGVRSALNMQGNTSSGLKDGEAPVTQHTLTVGAIGGRVLQPSSVDHEVSLNAGESYVVQVKPEVGYKLASIDVGINSYTPEEAEEAFGDSFTITDDYVEYLFTAPDNSGSTVIYMEFVERPTTRVTIKGGLHGTTSILNEQQAVLSKENGTYVIYQDVLLELGTSPETDYMVDKIVIKDASGSDITESAANGNTITVSGTEMTIEVSYKIADGVNTVTIVPTVAGTGGSISPSDSVAIPEDGKQDFIITPDPGYQISKVMVTYFDAEGQIGPVDKSGELQSGNGKSSIYWFQNVANDPAGSGAPSSIEVSFEPITYKMTCTEPIGGSLTGEIIAGEGTIESADTAILYEGASITYTAKAEEGYKLTSIRVDGVNVGALNSYTFNRVGADHSIEATFSKKNVLKTETDHQIVVQANNVTDLKDKLAENPYSFSLDGTHWTAPQKENTYTFYGLEPNKNYRVYVKVSDDVGNERINSNSSIYTMANTPAANGVEAVAVANKADKMVKITMDTTVGNPADDTEYLVYYSLFPNMTSESFDKNEDGSARWQTLDKSDNTVNISGLKAGTYYYLQVFARNKDGVITSAKPDNIMKILLSPSSPPENSFYFDEQSAPGEGITLHWDDAPKDILSVVIYRSDGTTFDLSTDLTSYVDNDTLRGNNTYTYTYAYKNAAGVGNERTAVSKLYHDAWAAAHVEIQPAGDDASEEEKQKVEEAKKAREEAQKKLEELDSIVNSDNDIIYEALTYPSFPKSIARLENSEGTEKYSGTLKYNIVPDEATTNTQRIQSYRAILKAYDPADGYAYKGTVGEPQWSKEIDRGAQVSWTGLNIDWEYQIYITAIETTAPMSASSTPSGNQFGIAGNAVGKRYLAQLMPDGTTQVSSVFEGRNANVPNWFKGSSFIMDETQAEKRNYPWEQPIKFNSEEYLKFNKSPGIAAPQSGELLPVQDALVTDKDGNQYILLNKGGVSSFIVNMAAWDPEGDTIEITAQIDGVPVGTKPSGTSDPIDKPFTTKEAATAVVDGKHQYYQVKFESAGMRAGVYDKITFKVTDKNGASSDELVMNDVKIIINEAELSIDLLGDSPTLIETDKIYTADERQPFARASVDMQKGNETGIRNLKLEIMAEQYTGLFGSNVMTAIQANLKNPAQSKYIQNAAELLGLEYTSNMTLDDNQILSAIDAVAPPLNMYFEATKAVYDAAPEGSRHISEDGLYWIESKYALENDKCDWLRLNKGDQSVKVIGAADAKKNYPVLLIARLGTNSVRQLTHIRIVEKPSATINNDLAWGWQTDTTKEHDAYREYAAKQYTIEDVVKTLYGDGTNCYYALPADYAAEQSKFAFRVIYEDGTISQGTVEADKTVDTYQYYSYFGTKPTIGQNSIRGSVVIHQGMYKYLTAGVVLTETNQKPNLNDSSTYYTSPKTLTNPNDDVNPTQLTDGSYGFNFNQQIKKGTTYYLWTYYQTPGSNQTVVEESSTTVTTQFTYMLASYGFDVKEWSKKEKNAKDGDISIPLSVTKNGDNGPTARITASVEYYEADEFGNIQRDGSNQEIKITDPDKLAAAKNVLSLQTDEMYFDASDTYNRITATLHNDEMEQGHMVARVTLAIDNDSELTSGSNILDGDMASCDIFIQDDESPVTSYLLDVVNKDELPWDSEKSQYNYQFKGLQEHDVNIGELVITYSNEGSGDLNNITATIYDAPDKKTPSTNFKVRQNPQDSSLPSKDTSTAAENLTGNCRIIPSDSLTDGVYTGYVCLSADNVEPEDEIWICIKQVVKQTTLKGVVYVGVEPNSPLELVGSANVYLYPAGTHYDSASGTFSKDPVYQTTTDAYGGTYKIENILNNGKDELDRTYYLVVERDGFLMYNGPRVAKYFVVDQESGTYVKNIALRAGDIALNNNGMTDGIINDFDLNLLTEYFNQNYDRRKDPAEYTETEKILRRCDFNLDGAVNALDRMILYSNWGASSSGYMNPETREYYYDYSAPERVEN